MHAFFSAIKSLVFPLVCPHCNELTKDKWPILCQGCFESLELLHTNARCPICFEPHERKTPQICHLCKAKKEPSHFQGPDYFAAAFEYFGPIKTLIFTARAPWLAYT
jgi:hypothetical protein